MASTACQQRVFFGGGYSVILQSSATHKSNLQDVHDVQGRSVNFPRKRARPDFLSAFSPPATLLCTFCENDGAPIVWHNCHLDSFSAAPSVQTSHLLCLRHVCVSWPCLPVWRLPLSASHLLITSSFLLTSQNQTLPPVSHKEKTKLKCCMLSNRIDVHFFFFH